MTYLKTIAILVLFLLSNLVNAENLTINPDHPDQYTVEKGDTLWDISKKFLHDPWLWPDLWNKNSQIVNPHLIYPGDTVYFSIVDGKPQLSLSKNSNKTSLSPQIRESATNQAIKLIPTDAIAQFLTSPRVVNRDTLSSSPYVIDFADEHLIVGAGDRVYVRSIPNAENSGYTIFREGEPYINPETKEVLGYEAQYIANANVERTGDPATLFITKSDSEIRRGDRVMVSSKNELALNYFPHPPEKQINGNIISVLDGVSQIGQHNIVVIDKGTIDGIEVGHTLTIYHHGRTIKDPYSSSKNETVKLPNEIAGLLMVFRSFERVSYALVLEATRSIHILDKVRTH